MRKKMGRMKGGEGFLCGCQEFRSHGSLDLIENLESMWVLRLIS